MIEILQALVVGIPVLLISVSTLLWIDFIFTVKGKAFLKAHPKLKSFSGEVIILIATLLLFVACSPMSFDDSFINWWSISFLIGDVVILLVLGRFKPKFVLDWDNEDKGD